MIRGYFATIGVRSRPFVDVSLTLAAFSGIFKVQFLVDTGADRTVIGPLDARRLSRHFGANVLMFPRGPSSTGVGGQMDTYVASAVITFDTDVVPLSLTILDPTSPLTIPSLLGRDILARYGLFLEERTGRVLLLEPNESDALQLP